LILRITVTHVYVGWLFTHVYVWLLHTHTFTLHTHTTVGYARLVTGWLRLHYHTVYGYICVVGCSHTFGWLLPHILHTFTFGYIPVGWVGYVTFTRLHVTLLRLRSLRYGWILVYGYIYIWSRLRYVTVHAFIYRLIYSWLHVYVCYGFTRLFPLLRVGCSVVGWFYGRSPLLVTLRLIRYALFGYVVVGYVTVYVGCWFTAFTLLLFGCYVVDLILRLRFTRSARTFTHTFPIYVWLDYVHVTLPFTFGWLPFRITYATGFWTFTHRLRLRSHVCLRLRLVVDLVTRYTTLVVHVVTVTLVVTFTVVTGYAVGPFGWLLVTIYTLRLRFTFAVTFGCPVTAHTLVTRLRLRLRFTGWLRCGTFGYVTRFTTRWLLRLFPRWRLLFGYLRSLRWIRLRRCCSHVVTDWLRSPRWFTVCYTFTFHVCLPRLDYVTFGFGYGLRTVTVGYVVATFTFAVVVTVHTHTHVTVTHGYHVARFYIYRLIYYHTVTGLHIRYVWLYTFTFTLRVARLPVTVTTFGCCRFPLLVFPRTRLRCYGYDFTFGLVTFTRLHTHGCGAVPHVVPVRLRSVGCLVTVDLRWFWLRSPHRLPHVYVYTVTLHIWLRYHTHVTFTRAYVWFTVGFYLQRSRTLPGVRCSGSATLPVDLRTHTVPVYVTFPVTGYVYTVYGYGLRCSRYPVTLRCCYVYDLRYVVTFTFPFTVTLLRWFGYVTTLFVDFTFTLFVYVITFTLVVVRFVNTLPVPIYHTRLRLRCLRLRLLRCVGRLRYPGLLVGCYSYSWFGYTFTHLHTFTGYGYAVDLFRLRWLVPRFTFVVGCYHTTLRLVTLRFTFTLPLRLPVVVTHYVYTFVPGYLRLLLVLTFGLRFGYHVYTHGYRLPLRLHRTYWLRSHLRYTPLFGFWFYGSFGYVTGYLHAARTLRHTFTHGYRWLLRTRLRCHTVTGCAVDYHRAGWLLLVGLQLGYARSPLPHTVTFTLVLRLHRLIYGYGYVHVGYGFGWLHVPVTLDFTVTLHFTVAFTHGRVCYGYGYTHVVGYGMDVTHTFTLRTDFTISVGRYHVYAIWLRWFYSLHLPHVVYVYGLRLILVYVYGCRLLITRLGCYTFTLRSRSFVRYGYVRLRLRYVRLHTAHHGFWLPHVTLRCWLYRCYVVTLLRFVIYTLFTHGRLHTRCYVYVTVTLFYTRFTLLRCLRLRCWICVWLISRCYVTVCYGYDVVVVGYVVDYVVLLLRWFTFTFDSLFRFTFTVYWLVVVITLRFATFTFTRWFHTLIYHVYVGLRLIYRTLRTLRWFVTRLRYVYVLRFTLVCLPHAGWLRLRFPFTFTFTLLRYGWLRWFTFGYTRYGYGLRYVYGYVLLVVVVGHVTVPFTVTFTGCVLPVVTVTHTVVAVTVGFPFTFGCSHYTVTVYTRLRFTRIRTLGWFTVAVGYTTTFPVTGSAVHTPHTHTTTRLRFYIRLRTHAYRTHAPHTFLRFTHGSRLRFTVGYTLHTFTLFTFYGYTRFTFTHALPLLPVGCSRVTHVYGLRFVAVRTHTFYYTVTHTPVHTVRYTRLVLPGYTRYLRLVPAVGWITVGTPHAVYVACGYVTHTRTVGYTRSHGWLLTFTAVGCVGYRSRLVTTFVTRLRLHFTRFGSPVYGYSLHVCWLRFTVTRWLLPLRTRWLLHTHRYITRFTFYGLRFTCGCTHASLPVTHTRVGCAGWLDVAHRTLRLHTLRLPHGWFTAHALRLVTLRLHTGHTFTLLHGLRYGLRFTRLHTHCCGYVHVTRLVRWVHTHGCTHTHVYVYTLPVTTVGCTTHTRYGLRLRLPPGLLLVTHTFAVAVRYTVAVLVLWFVYTHTLDHTRLLHTFTTRLRSHTVGWFTTLHVWFTVGCYTTRFVGYWFRAFVHCGWFTTVYRLRYTRLHTFGYLVATTVTFGSGSILRCTHIYTFRFPFTTHYGLVTLRLRFTFGFTLHTRSRLVATRLLPVYVLRSHYVCLRYVYV